VVDGDGGEGDVVGGTDGGELAAAAASGLAVRGAVGAAGGPGVRLTVDGAIQIGRVGPRVPS
jgi:hypothetical protein